MTDYDAGLNGLPQNIFSYFGPRLPWEVKGDKNSTRYDNLHEFFQTSFSNNQNVSLEYGKGNHSVRMSGSYVDENSPVPTNNFRKYNFRIVTNHKIGKTLEISPSLSYIKSSNDKPLRGVRGYVLSLLSWPVDNDAKDWLNPNGSKKGLFAGDPNAELDNPYFNLYRNRSRDELTRTVATLSVNYTPTKWLTINGRVGYDTYQQNGYTKWDSASNFLSRAQKGA